MYKEFDPRLEQAWWALRVGLGVGPFLAGLDKYFNLLANWPGYVSPLALKILPFSAQTFMHIVGMIEMIVGLAILSKWTRLGSYVASVWLLAIAINLVSTGMFFLGCRGTRYGDSLGSFCAGSLDLGSPNRLKQRHSTRTECRHHCCCLMR